VQTLVDESHAEAEYRKDGAKSIYRQAQQQFANGRDACRCCCWMWCDDDEAGAAEDEQIPVAEGGLI